MATLIIEHSDTAGSDLLGETLRDHGHRLRIVRPDRGESLPGDLDDIDAVVTCGGQSNPLDDSLDWIEPELDLLRAASGADLPVVGICLGNQLLARALGGTVSELDAPEVGWHTLRLSPSGREDPLYAGHAWESAQLHWHRFHVETPPPGARVLSRSDATPVQSWAHGLRTYGFQYHPEAHVRRVAEWADDDAASLTATKLTRAQLDADTAQHYPAAARLARRLFEAMALVLMPADRRHAGLAKDLHH